MPRQQNTNNNQFPAWALDPVLGSVMINPVKIKPCNHVVNNMTMMAWCNSSMCPVCQGPVTKIKPDKKLAKKIKSLKVDAFSCRLQPQEIDSLAFELEEAKGDDLVAIVEDEEEEETNLADLKKSHVHTSNELDETGLTDDSVESDSLNDELPLEDRRQTPNNKNIQRGQSLKKMLSKVFVTTNKTQR